MTRTPSRRAVLLGSASVLAGGGAAPAPRRKPAPPAAAATPTPEPALAPFAPRSVPRRVLALYDGRLEPRVIDAAVHLYAAMPIEWLGLVPIYQDVRHGLPAVWDDPDTRGVVTWFLEPCLDDLAGFVTWAERVVASGRKLVVVGNLGPRPGTLSPEQAMALNQRLLAAIGIRARGDWGAVTLGDRVRHAAEGLIGFERGFDSGVPPYEIYEPMRPTARSWLVMERAGGQGLVSHLVMITDQGGFVAPSYALGHDDRLVRQPWHINPFAFFRDAFAATGLPAPDTTTLCGRRVYYSHVDGDGWRSISAVRASQGARPTNAEVILNEVVSPNPDLPVTVAPIAAELDVGRVGDVRAMNAARRLLRLPHVEAATHTYTHPFKWSFFEDYTAEAERAFADGYRKAASGGAQVSDAAPAPGARCCAKQGPQALIPRAFGDKPFDLDEEVTGSARMIEQFAPEGKRVALLQWSGDCVPFPEALRRVEQAGIPNINGGDTRFDDEFPTVSSVAPIGLLKEGMAQVYASNSSEELYTELWTNRFFGFRDLPVTWARTEAPRRLKPMNLYYHMYSGERRAAVDALLSNIEALRRQEHLAVFASRYASAAQGFYGASIVQEAPYAWRVRERGGMQTIRFDDVPGRALDADACVGVLGSREVNGALYVALDPDSVEPVVALAASAPAQPSRAWLVQSSWEISRFGPEEDGFGFKASGFGRGVMEWLVPRPGRWTAEAGAWSAVVDVGDDLRLRLDVPDVAAGGVRIALRRAA